MTKNPLTMPNATVATAAIVDLEPIADSLRTIVARIIESHLPPWVDAKPFLTRQNCLEAARLVFHQGLADILAWTPRENRSGSVVHFPWRESNDGDPEGGEVDNLIVALIDAFGLRAYCQAEGNLSPLNGICTALQEPLDEWLLVLLNRQLSQIVGPYVYHAWHARPMGTAYVMQPGGIMINPMQLIAQANALGDLNQPMEVNLAEHWALAGQRHVNPLEETETMVSGDVVSEDPAVVSSFICEDIRKHPDPKAAVEAHEAGSRRPAVRSTRSKLDAIQEAYRRQSSSYTGPAKVGPRMPEESVESDATAEALAAMAKTPRHKAIVAEGRRRLKATRLHERHA